MLELNGFVYILSVNQNNLFPQPPPMRPTPPAAFQPPDTTPRPPAAAPSPEKGIAVDATLVNPAVWDLLNRMKQPGNFSGTILYTFSHKNLVLAQHPSNQLINGWNVHIKKNKKSKILHQFGSQSL